MRYHLYWYNSNTHKIRSVLNCSLDPESLEDSPKNLVLFVSDEVVFWSCIH